MREQFDDYGKKIMEEIDREAEEIQRAMEKCPEAAKAEAKDTLDQKVYAGIEAYEKAVTKNAAVASLSEEDREALRLGRELQARRREEESRKASGKKSDGKPTGKKPGMRKYIQRIAAAVVVLVVAASVGVEAIGGPERVVEIVKDTFYGREVSKISSSKDAVKKDDVEEEQAYQQIEDDLNIDPVRILITSGEMKYKYCDIDKDVRIAQLLYSYEERNVSYLIDASYTKETWGTDIEDGKTDEYVYTEGKLEVEVTEYELPESKEKRYSAEFEYQGVYYQLTGTMDKEVFEEILKNLHFPS